LAAFGENAAAGPAATGNGESISAARASPRDFATLAVDGPLPGRECPAATTQPADRETTAPSALLSATSVNLPRAEWTGGPACSPAAFSLVHPLAQMRRDELEGRDA
jgi:hypothetical protein